MSEPRNFANAAVIIACMYFLITGEFGIWAKAGIFFILLFSLVTWGYFHVTEDHKILLRKQIEETEAKIMNMKAGSQLLMMQARLLARGIKN